MNDMAPKDDKLNELQTGQERGYAAWKRAKVEGGLAQAEDRSAMIPAEQVLDQLKLAR